MRVSFVDVPLQNLGSAWIGLDRTLCRKGCFGGQLGRGEWIHFDSISIILCIIIPVIIIMLSIVGTFIESVQDF